VHLPPMIGCRPGARFNRVTRTADLWGMQNVKRRASAARARRWARCLMFTLAATAALAPVAHAGAQNTNPFLTARLLVNPDSDAAQLARAWAISDPADSQLLRKIATEPQAEWLGGWLPDAPGYVHWWIDTKLRTQGDTAFFVVYNIPHRDCSGHYSAGGAPDAPSYRAWVNGVAAAIGPYPSIIVLEPDAVPDSGCLSVSLQRERFGLLAYATGVLAAQPNTSVYIDAGRSDWRPAVEMARELSAAGVAGARGFSLDVTGYAKTANELRYGDQISRLLGGKNFIVSTSRNGRGPWPMRFVRKWEDLWCNEHGRALGPRPSTQTGDPRADAFEWVLRPGYSDGLCNGGGIAGAWWPAYALELSRNAAY
jgi:endoglucanase